MFVRYESFEQFIRYYPVVSILIAIHTILMLLSFLFPSLYEPVVHWGIGWNYGIAHGEYWRLITPIFLHGSFAHFAFNTFALFIFGPALERILGSFKFLAVYLFAGFLGNVGTFLFGEVAAYSFHLGASGAIYGLLGVYIYMKYFRQDLIDPASAQMVTTMLIIGIIYTFLVPRINILGHLFGFIGGAISGPIIFKGRVKYFTMPDSYVSSDNDNEIRFDPQRWQKSRQRKKILKIIAIGILVLLILLGLWEQL